MSAVGPIWKAMRAFTAESVAAQRAAMPNKAMAMARVCEEIPKLAKALEEAENLRKAAAMMKDTFLVSDALKTARLAAIDAKLVDIEIIQLKASYDEGSKAYAATRVMLLRQNAKIAHDAERLAKRNAKIHHLHEMWNKLSAAHHTLGTAHTGAQKSAALDAVRSAEADVGAALSALGVS